MIKICVYQTLYSKDGKNYTLLPEKKQFKSRNVEDVNIVIQHWNRIGDIGNLPNWKYIIVEIREATMTEWDDEDIPLRQEGSY